MQGESLQPAQPSSECQIDIARRELRILGSPVPVGGRVFEVIEILARSAGELVTKSELMDRIWPGAIVTENTIAVHAAAIRKALGPHRALLKTESGRGYRLLGSWNVQHNASAKPSLTFTSRRRIQGPSRNNLPANVMELVGRSTAINRLRDLVSAYRVVTLTGPGGIGKTVLALAVGRELLRDFDDGVWVIELASLSNPGLVPSASAQVLGLNIAGQKISADAVARAVGPRKLLLLLDNCEHVVDAAATLAETLVQLCPHIVVLATSREILRIEGEYVYRVPPLQVPTDGQAEAEHILSHGAVELFIARAEAQGIDIASRTDVLPEIATICRRLDGIPLAIEFAAAGVTTLGINQVAAGLNDRFALRTKGRRTAVSRHQTLRATLDWSYELLPEPERRLLCRLAVFAGDFGLEAATAVSADKDRALVVEGIANLVAKSLVIIDTSSSQGRWKLLETIRDYASRKLAQSGEGDEAQRRHAVYFRDRFAPSKRGLSARLSNQELVQNRREIDNVRAALDWSFSPVGDNTIGADLTAAYAPVWLNLSLMGECRERCERALTGLAADSAAGTRMHLRIALGSVMALTGPVEQTSAMLTEALVAAEDLNDLDAQARAMWALATLQVTRGEFGEVLAAAERLQRIAEKGGDPTVAFLAQRFMGDALLAIGRPGEARLCFERALRFPVVPDDQPLAIWFHPGERASASAQLSRTLWVMGFLDQAQAEARASFEEVEGTPRYALICRVLYYGLCRVALVWGDLETADRAIAHLVAGATRASTPFWGTYGRFLEGKLLVERGEFAQGAAILRSAFDTCRRTGWRASWPEFMGALAQALVGLGQFDQALAAVEAAIADANERESGQRIYIPELLRMKGEILARTASSETMLAAEDCFEQASEMAREQGALFWELRVALSLARLWSTQNRREEARDILSRIYDRFTEGFTAPDLRAARALLDTLST